MKKESLYIKTTDASGRETFFPKRGRAAKINTYTYTAQRMGGTPTITATLMYKRCLDNEWTKKEYVVFNGEKYYITQVPTSSKSNDELFYSHELTFVSERVVLETTYFFDVVTRDKGHQEGDAYRSNSTQLTFHGNIREFVERLNDSMIYSGLYDDRTSQGYHVVIDEGISSEDKDVSFDNKYLSEALQEIYNTFKLTYYFVGKVCHVGYSSNAITTAFEYGSDTGLLSISKTNANYKIIDRITGTGSSDNIPYYYPNQSAEGTALFTTTGTLVPSSVDKIDLAYLLRTISGLYVTPLKWARRETNLVNKDKNEVLITGKQGDNLQYTFRYEIKGYNGAIFTFTPVFSAVGTSNSPTWTVFVDNVKQPTTDGAISITMENEDTVQVSFFVLVPTTRPSGTLIPGSTSVWLTNKTEVSYPKSVGYGFEYGDDKFLTYNNSGILLKDLSLIELGDTIQITGRDYIPPQQNLMPSIYRATKGDERFYNAVNCKYPLHDGKGTYTFNNLYIKGFQHEGTQAFEDIRPTISGMKNKEGKLFGEIADVAFDLNDNDSLGDGTANDTFNGTDEYIHSWFYIKLNIFDGDYGFNIFTHALADEAAYIEMTSGVCAACKFEIGVIKEQKAGENKYTFYNPVQTTNGNIVEGDFNQKINKYRLVPEQQDTSKHSVWIAVKKETSTFGVVMPHAEPIYRPKAGDKFVITGISLPQEYIYDAEKRLENALIQYMKENNDEKFTFSASFSRIYLQRHPQIAKMLNENARLKINYNGTEHVLYVSTYTCRADENVLCEISVELTDVLTVSQNTLQTQMDAVKGDILSSLETRSGDVLAQGLKYFIRKDIPDSAKGHITFEDGASFSRSGNYYIDKNGISRTDTSIIDSSISSPRFVDGFNGEGWRLWTDGGDGLARLTLDELTVRKTMRIFELLIEKIRSVGGVIVVSAANGKVKTVAEDGESYVLTFEAATGFVKGDLMRCQTFKRNTMKLKGYWVTVAAASADGLTVTVAKSEFAGVVPEAGDECVLMGNTTNEKRQNMVMISATEDRQPRVDVMNGIRAKNFNGALRARLGNLDGIRDDYFPADNQPHGDGLYADNAYIHGTFILANGGDVNVLLQVLQNKIESAITSKRQDDISGSYLRNAAFGEGMRYWTYENNRQPYVTNKRDGGTVNTDGGFLTSSLTSGTEAAVVGVKTCAHMVPSREHMVEIVQEAADMQNLPFLSEYPYVNAEAAQKGENTDRKALMTYLSFRVKCVEDADFEVHLMMTDEEKKGFEKFTPLEGRFQVEASDDFQLLTCSGLWNGKGRFVVTLNDGEIYITDLVLNRDQVDVQYRTLFEQTDKFLKWAAMKLDKNGNVLSSSQILTKAEFNEISSSKFNETTGQLENQSKLITEADGAKLVSKAINEKELVTQSEMSVYVQKDGDGYISNAKIKADRISLEGYTTINEFFKIDEDGKMWATDGTFSGGITATSGTIGGFEINNTSFGANNIKTSQGNASVNIDPRRISFSLISEDRARTAYIGTYSITEGGADSMLRLTDTGGGVEGGLQGITKKAVMTFDVSGASDINCAFRGKGSGVLNGMICGYGVGDIDIMGGKQHPLVKDGDTIILTNDTPNTVVLPALTEMQKSLGIDDGSSFNFKIYLINNSGGTLTLKGNRQDGGAPIDKTRPNMYGLQLLNGYCYAILLVYDGNDYRGYTLGGN